MKNNKKLFLFMMLAGICLPTLSACGAEKEGTILRVLNLEDYIYLYEEDPEEDTETPEEDRMDLVDQFARDMEEKYPEMAPITVIYTTTDTNETMYNELLTGKAVYDCVCTSDYMLQKLIIDDLIEPINKELIPLYYDEDESCACEYVKNQLDQITAKNLTTQKVEKLEDYAVGYMWGTLGILYNPEFEGFTDYALENIHDDVKTWDFLWDENYYGVTSVKNSMRDTYAIGILKAYEEELLANQASLSPDEYSIFLGEVFNRFEQKDVDIVKDELNSLKKNVFGLEVDSGKLDIATGKIGVNIAWSGDAVYSMELAEGFDKDLYYAIPELGSNIWFDGWAIPKRPASQPRTENEMTLAHEFLNYLCDPHVVSENMNYTGYTSFIGGEEVRDLIRDWYDARTDLMYYYDEENDEYYEVYYMVDGEEYCIEYEDFEPSEHKDEYNDLALYYYQPDPIDEDIAVETPFINPFDEETEMTYGDITIEKLLENEEVKVVDLQYFFGDEQYDYRFYSYLYLPFVDEGNISAGLDFFCQFPDENTIKRCAVMKFDYENNERVVKMWEDFKSDSLPVWAIVLFVIELVALGGIIFNVTFNKTIKKKIRERRIAQK